jgi:hypothetical protein
VLRLMPSTGVEPKDGQHLTTSPYRSAVQFVCQLLEIVDTQRGRHDLCGEFHAVKHLVKTGVYSQGFRGYLP